MLLFFWSLVFAAALLLLVKSADLLTGSAIKLAANLKIPAFIMGLTVVSLGTSLPELSASIAAVLRGRGELAAALAIGSTIAGILLVVGASVISAKMLSVRKRLLDLDASLFAISLVLFYFMARDQAINALEGIILLAGFLVCIFYVMGAGKDDELTSDSLLTPDLLSGKDEAKLVEILPGRIEKSLAAKNESEFSLKAFFTARFRFCGFGNRSETDYRFAGECFRSFKRGWINFGYDDAGNRNGFTGTSGCGKRGCQKDGKYGAWKCFWFKHYQPFFGFGSKFHVRESHSGYGYLRCRPAFFNGFGGFADHFWHIEKDPLLGRDNVFACLFSVYC